MNRVNENSFTPMFLASLTVLELAMLQHELRTFPEDRANLDAVLAELKARSALSVVSAVPREEQDQDHGGTSLTEGDAVSVLVPTPQLSHAVSQRDAMIAVAQLEQAHREMCDAVQRQWNSGHAFKLSIPANPERDTDLIIGAAIRFAMLVLKPLAGSGNQPTQEHATAMGKSAAPENNSRPPETK